MLCVLISSTENSYTSFFPKKHLLYSASWQHLPNGDNKNSQCLVFPFKCHMIILQYFPETTENTPKLVSWLASYIHSLEESHWYYSWGLAKVQNIIAQAHLWTRYKRHNIFLKKTFFTQICRERHLKFGRHLGGHGNLLQWKVLELYEGDPKEASW